MQLSNERGSAIRRREHLLSPLHTSLIDQDIAWSGLLERRPVGDSWIEPRGCVGAHLQAIRELGRLVLRVTVLRLT